MDAKLALVSVGMNTPVKVEEERIWASWFRGMFGGHVYLINNVSQDDRFPLHPPHPAVDHREAFANPGHIPGVCEGLNRGLDHLRARGFRGAVVLTAPDVVADEGFADILEVIERGRWSHDAYGHDWTDGYVATDFLFLTPHAWPVYRLPERMAGSGRQVPLMLDGNKVWFPAPAHTPMLEKWNLRHMTRERGWRLSLVAEWRKPGPRHGIGATFDIEGCRFRIVHSGGESRPDEVEATALYRSFDRPFRPRPGSGR